MIRPGRAYRHRTASAAVFLGFVPLSRYKSRARAGKRIRRQGGASQLPPLCRAVSRSISRYTSLTLELFATSEPTDLSSDFSQQECDGHVSAFSHSRVEPR